MKLLGFTRTVVLNGKDESGVSAVDEVSPAGETVISELMPSGEIRSYSTVPEDFGITPFSLGAVTTTGCVETEKERFLSVISGEGPEECTEFTCMNAGVLLYCAELVKNFKDGTEYAREKLDEWIILQGQKT
jgi:anthranilate phosphoribosyltransferase